MINEKDENQFEIFLKQGDFANAENTANRLIAENPSSPVPYSMRALLYETMGRLKDSIKDYQKADELAPSNPEYIYWICEIYLMFYDIPNTLKFCKMGQERFPGDYHFKMVEADAWLWKISVDDLKGEDREEALENSRKILDKCLLENPEDGEIKVIEGTWFLQKGNVDKCLECFQFALEYGLEVYADFVDTGLVLAILNLRKNEKERAGEYIEKSLDYFRKWKEPHYLKLFLFYEHLLMLREVFLGEKVTVSMLKPFREEYEELLKRGMRVHHVTRSLRNHILDFIEFREKGDYAEALQSLDNALKIFNDRLPLCIIFNTIKRPSLLEILNKFREEMKSCISNAC